MIKNTIVLYILFITHFLFSQSLEIKIKNFTGEKIFIHSVSGESDARFDSVYASASGLFRRESGGKSLPAGMFRIYCLNKWFNLVSDGKDISVETDYLAIQDSLRIIKSDVNKSFYSFLAANRNYKLKTDILIPLTFRYPKDDDFYNSVLKKISELQSEYIQVTKNLIQTEPGSFISRYIKSSRLPVVSPYLSMEKQLEYLKSSSLDNLDFNDARLINSDAFSNKVIEYLTYYRNPQLPKQLLEKEFMIAVDTILNKAKVNTLVYKHIAEYLLNGFKKFGFDDVIDYMVQNYVVKDDICLSDELEKILNKRILQSKKFKTGLVILDIKLIDDKGKEFNLYSINSENILILFYATWCPHCNKMLTELLNYYNPQKKNKFEIIAISLDTNRTDWLSYIQKNKFNWINCNSDKGYDSDAAKEFSIYATPTMFHVNSKKELIKKPVNVSDFIYLMDK